MLQVLILINAQSSAYWEKKENFKKEVQLGAFFPGSEARHALLAVSGGIFT
jgi:hypothetical protein